MNEQPRPKPYSGPNVRRPFTNMRYPGAMNAPAPPSTLNPAQPLAVRRERRLVRMRGFVRLEDGRSVEIVLLDLSYDGCGIEIPIELEPGQPLKLGIFQRGEIDTEVRWYANGKAGLVFRTGEPVEEEQQHPRTSDRCSLSVEATMRRLGQNKYRVRVFDLSPTGCKIEHVEVPKTGERVMIKFEGLEPIEAEVCWIENHIGGVRFSRPIHPAVFDLLVARLSGGGTAASA